MSLIELAIPSRIVALSARLMPWLIAATALAFLIGGIQAHLQAMHPSALVVEHTGLSARECKRQIPANQFSPCLLQNVWRNVLVTSIALIHLAFL